MTKILVPIGFSSEKKMPAHIARLKNLAKWYLPKEDSAEWVDFRLQSAAAYRNPAYRKNLKDAHKVSKATSIAVSNNGAGLPADAGIREFGNEYNRRVAQHGLHYLPTSFNIFEAYFDYSAKYGIFVPLKEKDHVCSLSGFFDFLTSPEGSLDLSADLGEAYLLDEDVIYNYSFVDDPGAWMMGSEASFGVISASLVRRGNELVATFLSGKRADLRAETEKIIETMATAIPNPDKPSLQPDPELKAEAVGISGVDNSWRTYLSFRYDLKAKKLQARYIITDNGNSWGIVSDDPVTLSSIREYKKDFDFETYYKKNLAPHDGLFVALLRFIKLPAYFNEKREFVTKEKAITGLADIRSGAHSARRSIDKSLSTQIVYEREVCALPQMTSDVSAVTLPALELAVEVDGFWERLPFGSYGEGPDGERILGRTWVRRTLAKRQSQIGIGPILISADRNLAKNDEGYIYVLRNAAFDLDMFKIGLTRRDVTVRASELSRGTGIPDKFLVVQYWVVPDVVYAENRIHELLDHFRVRDQREFFKADYPIIRATIDMVVSEMAGRKIN